MKTGLFVASLSVVSAFAPSQHQLSLSYSALSASAPPVLEIVEDVLPGKQFIIAPTDLIERAKDVLINKGIGVNDDGECLAEDFEFIAAVVGPIGKKDYINALKGFKIEDGFDLINKYFGFNVDPTQPNRVWFFQRLDAVHTGEFMGKAASGKEIVYPPQVLHMDFNAEGDLTEFGFYTVDRRQGNTGGLGGAFGLMWAIDRPLPIPECQPYKASKRFRFLQLMGNIGKKFAKKQD